MTLTRLTLVLGALLTAQACTLLPEPEPNPIYLLPNQSPIDTGTSGTRGPLRIDTPEANQTLTSRRLLVMPRPHQLNVYKGARWNDQAPVVLREHLVETFQRSEAFTAILSGSRRAHTPVTLVSHLRAFQSEYVEGRPQVVIRLDAQLLSTKQQRIVAARSFEVIESSDGPDIPRVVEAFGRAADQLGRNLVQWTLNYYPRP